MNTILDARTELISHLAFSSTDQWVVSVDWEPNISLYDLGRSKRIRFSPAERLFTGLPSVAFDRLGRTMFVGSGEGFSRWDVESQACISSHVDPHVIEGTGELAAHPREDVLALSCDTGICLWDYSNEKHLSYVATVSNYRLLWLSLGCRMISHGGNRNVLSCWSYGKEQGLLLMRELLPDTKGARPTRLAAADSGNHFFSGHSDGSVRCWDVEKGRITAVAQAHDRSGGGVDLLIHHSREPLMLSAGGDGKLLVWDSERFRIDATVQLPASWGHYSVDIAAGAFSHSDHRVALAERWHTRGNPIRLKDAEIKLQRGSTYIIRLVSLEDLLVGWETPRLDTEEMTREG